TPGSASARSWSGCTRPPAPSTTTRTGPPPIRWRARPRLRSRGLPVEPLLRGRGRSSRGSAEAGRFESEVEGEAVVAVGEVAAGEAPGLAEPVVEGLAVDAERGGRLLGVAAEVQVDLDGLGQLRVQA